MAFSMFNIDSKIDLNIKVDSTIHAGVVGRKFFYLDLDMHGHCNKRIVLQMIRVKTNII